MNMRDHGRRSARRLTAILAGLGILGAGALGAVLAVEGTSSGSSSSSSSASTSTSSSTTSGSTTSTTVAPGGGSASNATSTGS